MGFLFGDDDKPPPAPDPEKTAAAQYKYNSAAARDGAFLNAVDQYGPYGSTTFARRPDGTPYAQAVTLSPEVQAMLDAQFGAGTALNQAAAKQLSFLPQDKFQLPGSPSARENAVGAFGEKTLDADRFADPLADPLYKSTAQSLGPTNSTGDIAKTSYDQAMALQQPDLDASRKSKEVELATRGIPVGSEIWKDEMNRLDGQAAGARNSASRQAVLDSGAEQSRQFGMNLSGAQFGSGEDARLAGADMANKGFLGTTQNQQFNQALQALGYGSNTYQTDLSNKLLERNQPISEYAALAGSTPNFQSPSFMNTAAQSVAPPDYTGVVNNNYNTASANYRADQASSSSPWNAIGSIGSSFAGSKAGSAALASLSDENAKEDRTSADGEDILEAFREMPVDDYRYTDEARSAINLPEHRTGTMAQDYAEHFGGDGKTIDMADAVGKLMAAMKALDARTMDRRAA